MNFGNRIIVWYDRKENQWTAVYKNTYDEQVGKSGHGESKSAAIADVKYKAAF